MTLSPLTDAQRAAFERDGFLAISGLFARRRDRRDPRHFHGQAKDGPVPGLSDVPKAAVAGNSDPLARYPRMMHPHKHPDKPVGRSPCATCATRGCGRSSRSCSGRSRSPCQSMFYFKPPGARGQDLHQDNFYLRVKPGTCMAAWVAIDDADEGNGGMMCVPQTAKLDIACPEKADPALFFTTEHVEPPPGLEPQMMRLEGGRRAVLQRQRDPWLDAQHQHGPLPPLADLPLRAGEHGGDEPLVRGGQALTARSRTSLSTRMAARAARAGSCRRAALIASRPAASG